MKHDIVNFYKDIYRDNLVGTNHIIGFKNDYFNNPIMTPHFVLSDDCSLCDVLEHKKLMGREKYWVNTFSKKNNFYDLHLYSKFQYVQNIAPLLEPFVYSYEIQIKDRITAKERNEIKVITMKNASNLDSEGINGIEQVIQDSHAKIEYLLTYDKGLLVGAITVLHSANSSLFINGSLNNEYRGKGIFKEMISRLVNHCLINLEQKSTFYWTFNSILKDRGDLQLNSYIYS